MPNLGKPKFNKLSDLPDDFEINEEMIAKFTKKCIMAIQKLHLHGTSHGHLTANNIFVTKDFQKIKITDYANLNALLDDIAVVHEMTFVWTNLKKIFEMCILE